MLLCPSLLFSGTSKIWTMNPWTLVSCLLGKLVQVSSWRWTNLCSTHVHLASEEFACRNISHQSVMGSDDDLSAVGISIKQTLREMNLEYCILGKKEVRIAGSFERVVSLFARSSRTTPSPHEPISIRNPMLKDEVSGQICLTTVNWHTFNPTFLRKKCYIPPVVSVSRPPWHPTRSKPPSSRWLGTCLKWNSVSN